MTPKMQTTFTYKLLKASWGIYIEITAELTTLSRVTSPTRRVAEGILLCVSQSLTDSEGRTTRLTASEMEWLCRGIGLVADKVKILRPVPIVVHLLQFSHAPCDYQEESLACCIAGWLARKVGIEAPQFQVHYDQPRNRYEFTFPVVE